MTSPSDRSLTSEISIKRAKTRKTFRFVFYFASLSLALARLRLAVGSTSPCIDERLKLCKHQTQLSDSSVNCVLWSGFRGLLKLGRGACEGWRWQCSALKPFSAQPMLFWTISCLTKPRDFLRVCLPAVLADSFTLWESMEMMMSSGCDEIDAKWSRGSLKFLGRRKSASFQVQCLATVTTHGRVHSCTVCGDSLRKWKLSSRKEPQDARSIIPQSFFFFVANLVCLLRRRAWSRNRRTDQHKTIVCGFNWPQIASQSAKPFKQRFVSLYVESFHFIGAARSNLNNKQFSHCSASCVRVR